MTASEAHGRLIVVVDDDPSIVEGLAMVLEAWDFQVFTALTVDDLARRLADMPGVPGLVLADHFLPGNRTGAEAVELVRGHVGSPVPAIILTGDTTPERQAEAAAAGYRLLHKPVQVPALRAAVEELFRG
ncbi:response regulator [Azospirillum sp.]|uniref:response regulator n=1 Tax=Azospirillum sp. TaxID=34012 RepID=UPI003D704207